MSGTLNSTAPEIISAESPVETPHQRRARVAWTFCEWCFQREAFNRWSYATLLIPLLAAGEISRQLLQWPWYSSQGRRLLEGLVSVAAFFVFANGIGSASKAVCWEVSDELLDLVRLTDIDPATMLWAQTIRRWWTIWLSVLLIVPLGLFANLLGGATSVQWTAAGYGLLLLSLLTAGFAMIASVSSGGAANAGTAAAFATFVQMFLYHLLFWGVSIAVHFESWLVNGSWFPVPSAWENQVSNFAHGLAPTTQIYRAIMAPDLFSPLDPSYWIHFVTALYCMRLASIVICNRFRNTSVSARSPSQPVAETTVTITPCLLRPRFQKDPFFWKDVYILGGGELTQSLWTAISYLAVIGVVTSIFYGISLPIGILTICVAPWIIAFQFDALMAAEFRGQTWSSLMVLPVDPRQPILSKIRAALWERKHVLVPVAVAAIVGCFSDPVAVLMALTIVTLIALMLFEISIFSQFNAKVWWAGPVVGVFVLFLIGFTIGIWANFDRVTSFFMTTMLLSVTVGAFYANIEWRLRNWSEER